MRTWASRTWRRSCSISENRRYFPKIPSDLGSGKNFPKKRIYNDFYNFFQSKTRDLVRFRVRNHASWFEVDHLYDFVKHQLNDVFCLSVRKGFHYV